MLFVVRLGIGKELASLGHALFAPILPLHVTGAGFLAAQFTTAHITRTPDPPARADCGDHGDLRPSFIEGPELHLSGWEIASMDGLLLYFVAVRGSVGRYRRYRIWPLTWGGGACRLLALDASC